jgi:nitroimidazol reductase NimA-like FMN-containing flavoprotein (pyridoxamine 5'-phosphate oxidase superfamily)
VFGITASQAVGSSLNDLIMPKHVRHIRPLDVKQQYDRRHLRRAPALRADGTLFTAEFTVNDLRTADGGGSIVMLRDASEMGSTVRKLRERVAKLESDMERLVALSRPAGRPEARMQSTAGCNPHAIDCRPEARRRKPEPSAEASARGDAHVAGRIDAVLTSQVQCVLATTTADLRPATFLMAFAISPCLRFVVVATHGGARKAQQMRERPAVSLLWDNRTGNLRDHADGLLVTAVGQAAKVTAEAEVDALPWASARFLARNPNMANFLASEGVGLFQIRVDSYEIIEGYGRPERWAPHTKDSSTSSSSQTHQ